MASDASHLVNKLGLSPGLAVERPALRVRVKWNATLRIENREIPVRVWDISREGLSFITDATIPLGTAVSLLLHMHGLDDMGQRLAAPIHAEVRNSILTRDGFRLGAHIRKIDAEHQHLLGGWVERLAARGG